MSKFELDFGSIDVGHDDASMLEVDGWIVVDECVDEVGGTRYESIELDGLAEKVPHVGLEVVYVG